MFHVDNVCTVVSLSAITLATQAPNIMSDLIEKTQEASITLREAAQSIGEHLETLKPMKKEVIEELRSLRMTVASEVATMLKPLEDLRKFFLGAEHAKEVARLQEFAALCERLEKLKTTGFLDKVADTMLKLA